MSLSSQSPYRYILIINILSGLVISISGFLVIIGWQQDINSLKTFGFGDVPLKANLGAAFLLSGLILMSLQYGGYSRILSRILSVIVSIIGTVTTTEILLNIDFGVDNIVFQHAVEVSSNDPTRMALNAALSLIFIGITGYSLSNENTKIGFFHEFSLVFPLSISFLGLIGFIFGLAGFSESTGYTNMAILATILFIINCISLLLTYLRQSQVKISIDQKLFGSFVFIASTFVFMTLISDSAFRIIRQTSDKVEHTQIVKNYLDQILSDIIDVETGVRGYIISNNEDYLVPMLKAKDDLSVSLNEIKILVQDHESQRAFFDSLEYLVDARVRHAELLRSIFMEKGNSAAVLLFKTDQGKNLTDKIRVLIDRIKENENLFLKTSNEAELTNSIKARGIIYSNLIIQIGFLTLIFFIVLRNIKLKRNALNQLNLLNENLEAKVMERTASLSRSEERFRSTLDSMMEGCQILGFGWEYKYINRAAEIHNGRPKDEFIGKRYMDMWPGIEKTEVFRIIKKCLEGRVSSHMENEFTFPDGKVGWFDLRIQPVPEGVFILSVDITEHKKAENSLKESEEKFKSIIENSADAIFLTDQEGNYTYINKSAIQILGFSQEEILSKHITDITPREKIDEYAGLFTELVRSGKLFAEIDLVKSNGEILPVDLNAVVLPGGTVYGSCRDISERRKTQRELDAHRHHLEELIRERTEKLQEALVETRDLYENAPCGYHSLDHSGVFRQVNETELKWLGYTREEVIGKKSFGEFLAPESLETFKSNYPKFIEKGFIDNLEFRLIRKDGSDFWVTISATALYKENGEFLMSRSVLLDISKRKEMEAELQKAKKEAEEANKAKSEFLANMSHEIRTPMNAVLGYTELLGGTEISQTQKEYIDSVKSSGKSLLTLINDILDLSKIEAGKLELEYEFIGTKAFFSEFERIFSLKLVEKGIKFILDIASGTPSGIYVDEARVRQIIFNLIGNAVKFTKEGSIRLKVFIENPQISTYPGGRTEEFADLVIEVSDTGIGISKELQERIFEPFTQERSFKHYGGTGLGLTITRRLLSLMNGTISVKSEESIGSAFTVRIPEISYKREFISERTDIRINPSEIIFNEALILIADDVEHNRSYLKDVLKNTSLKTIEAEDGEIALEMAGKFVPDLVIADIRMPKLDGFQLLEKIKSDNNLKHIPVLAYSASVLKDQKERIHNSDFSGLMIKPVNIIELYMALMNVLPYTTISMADTGDLVSGMNENGEIIDHPELIKSLETTFNDKWKTFAITQPLDEINLFATGLLQLGQKHSSQSLVTYGKELIDAAESFNVDALLRLLEKFKYVLENLKKSGKSA